MSGTNDVAGHAFLSYVREDKARVDQLQQVLVAAGIPVWRDIRDLQPGQDWKLSVSRAIGEDALAFIACFSRASQVKPRSYQNEELLLAIEQFRQRPPGEVWLIPVRFDDCDVPGYDLGAGRTLASLHRADLFGDTCADHTARLVQTIGQILGRNLDAAATLAPAEQVAPRSPAGSSPEFAFLPDGPVLEGLPDGSDFVFMKFSPDGRYLATGVHSNVHVWDTTTGRAVGPALRTGRPLQEMTFLPDSRVLVVAMGGHSVARWDLRGSAPAAASASISGGRALVISPDGHLFAVCRDKTVLLLPTDSGFGHPRAVKRGISGLVQQERWPGHPVFSFDRSLIAFTLDGDAHVRDTTTLREVMRPLRHRSGAVDRISFSRDTRFVVTKADNLRGGRSVTLWDATVKRPAGWEIDASPELSDHTRMRFFAGGNIVALADPGQQGRKASVRFWNTSTRLPLGSITSDSSGYYEGFMFADSVSISPDGQWAADIRGGKVCMWNMATLRRVARSGQDPGGLIYGIAFTPDWRLMATCVRPRKGPMIIRIWHPDPDIAR